MRRLTTRRPEGGGYSILATCDVDLTDEQILEKLLALNLERAAAEKKSATKKQPRVSCAKTDEEFV